MKKMIILSVLFSFSAQANILCKAQTQMGQARIEISDTAVIVTSEGLSHPVVFKNLQYSYDGHMTQMITAPGLAVSYENWYGCIHNARVITSFRDNKSLIESVDIGLCSGGSTPDSICHAN